MELLTFVLVVSWLVLHVGGILVAWVTRVVAGQRLEALLHAAYFVAMVGVGAAAVAAHVLELALWALSVATLMVMMLTAIVDFRRTHEPGHAAHRISSR